MAYRTIHESKPHLPDILASETGRKVVAPAGLEPARPNGQKIFLPL
jgi:hypothetical protein